MRVLILSQYFWPETFRINEVAIALRDAGCEVTVLTGQPNYPEGLVYEGYSPCSVGSESYDGITVFRVPLAPRGEGSGLKLILNYLSFVVSASAIGPWLLRGRSFDTIFVFGLSPILQVIPGVWLAWLKKSALITWVQDLWPDSLSATGYVKDERLLGLVAQLVKWIYKKNDLLLVQSHAFVEPVSLLAESTPVIYHPNPGDFAFSDPVASGECPIIFDKGFSVVFAGNFGTVQSLETILEAANLLKNERDIHFILVGNGSRMKWLQMEVDRLGLTNLRLPGRFPLSTMPIILSKASVLLVSLIRNQIMSQTVPSKVQAYLAAGKPIIASLDGEGARIVEEANAGLACPAEDAKELADAVKRLRDAPEEQIHKMGQNARKYYEENFEPRLLASRLLRILSGIKKDGA